MLLERRSVEELEQILEDRLTSCANAAGKRQHRLRLPAREVRQREGATRASGLLPLLCVQVD